ncbi:MAG: hypothetical protein EOP36_20500 [Rubrivivax sp.]|nr:MAG: hypothetical protein EOP36_20500 [Rubrivivax sp.]
MQKILVISGAVLTQATTDITIDDMPQHIQVALLDLTNQFSGDIELVSRDELLAKLGEPRYAELREYLPLWHDMGRSVMEPLVVRSREPVDLDFLNERDFRVLREDRLPEKPWERQRGDHINRFQMAQKGGGRRHGKKGFSRSQ